jgi:soluble lytic murein transglycosylase
MDFPTERPPFPATRLPGHRVPLRILVAMMARMAIAIMVGGCSIGSEGLASTRGSGMDPVEEELAAGRHRRAAQLLRERLAVRVDTTPAEVLKLSRAELEWGHASEARRLLEDRSWLDEEDAGGGWRVLARAAEGEGRWEEAAAAWARLAAREGLPGEASLRRIRALARGRRPSLAAVELEALSPGASRVAVGWLALEVGRAAAEAGDTTAVRRALALAEGEPGVRGETLPPRARLQAGDSAGALRRWRALATESRSAAVRATAGAEAGALGMALGDTVAALRVLRGALGVEGSGPGVRRAAGLLLESRRPLDGAELLRVARVLEGADGARALEAFDRLRALGTPTSLSIRLTRARLLSTLGHEGAEEELTALAGSGDAGVVPAALELLARLRRQAGNEAEAVRLEDRLIVEFPATVQALDLVFFRGDAAHDRQELEEAAERYREASMMLPDQDRAGLARMRWGQLLLTTGDPAGALEVFEGYLEDFPRGRRWDEAAYWAARIRMEAGDSAGAMPLLRRIRAEDPLGYHAVLSHHLDGTPFRPGLPESTVPAGPRPPWMEEGLGRVALLRSLELDEGARAEREALEARAGNVVADLLHLAEGLHAIGLHLDGVNLGWEARRLGHPWDLRLARIIYPFPLRPLVFREARERGVDPWLVAAVIRQESAFMPAAVSPAGAVGLMQILPTSGEDLAVANEVEPYSRSLLGVPEVSVLFGTTYLRDLLERHDHFLPLALSAYNAGPARASRWRGFPEAADPQRFVERIPYAETRGYVRNVIRNQAVYRHLYP